MNTAPVLRDIIIQVGGQNLPMWKSESIKLKARRRSKKAEASVVRKVQRAS